MVVTTGTTALGAVDPLDRILDLRSRYGFRVHVDAAYGGYFKLASNLDANAARAFARIAEADSIVVDPHKHGLQPYGCGCVLFRDPQMGRFYKHDSPYTYFTSAELHLGEISLECSRAGASAVALWATQRLLPLIRAVNSRRASNVPSRLPAPYSRRSSRIRRFISGPKPELDILVWAIKASTSKSLPAWRSRSSTALQSRISIWPWCSCRLHFSRPAAGTGHADWPEAQDDAKVTCLRSVLMKPEHLAWVDEIWKRLDRAAA